LMLDKNSFVSGSVLGFNSPSFLHEKSKVKSRTTKSVLGLKLRLFIIKINRAKILEI
jgi:hypothetical protein